MKRHAKLETLCLRDAQVAGAGVELPSTLIVGLLIGLSFAGVGLWRRRRAA